jgi:YYY domain-containing protein
MNEVTQAIRWYAAVQVCGLVALPLCARVLGRLADTGHGVSKSLGLLLVGWVFWLTTSFGWTHNSIGGVLVALGVVGLGSVAAGRYRGAALRDRWPSILLSEVVFAGAFCVGCLVRARMPRIETAGGEKWMEIAFLNALQRAESFPPQDPWLSGFGISYYYFGYVIVSMVGRLARVAPSTAFNLGVATTFALTAAGAFGLGIDLWLGSRVKSVSLRPSAERWANAGEPTPRISWRSVACGFLACILLTTLGNVEGLLEVLHARGIGSAAAWAWLDISGIDGPATSFREGAWVPSDFFWWWRASRVLQDYSILGTEQQVIDEFPAFSFVLGDLHPHLLALPFVLVALALSFALYLRVVTPPYNQTHLSQPGQATSKRTSLTTTDTIVYAICLGGLGFLNTWDFPIYVSIAAVSLLVGLARREGSLSHAVLTSAGWLVVQVLLGFFLYLPFWVGFRSQAGGAVPNFANATRLPQFLVMFLPLVVPCALFLLSRARRSGTRPGTIMRYAAVLVAGATLLVAVVLVLAVALVGMGWLSPIGPLAFVKSWLDQAPLTGAPGSASSRAVVAEAVWRRVLDPWTALLLATLIVSSVLTTRAQSGKGSPGVRRNGTHDMVRGTDGEGASQPVASTEDLVLVLCGSGALLCFCVEFVYLRDVFLTRMNTVFKFYFQAWVLWALVASYALVDLAARRRTRALVACGALVAAGLVYPALAVPARAREYGGQPTLDGTAYLAKAHADDYEAVQWLNSRVIGTPVLLESPGDGYRAYVYDGRVSALTGLPTLLGWAGHEHQWRGTYEEQSRRESDIERLFATEGTAEALALLAEYDVCLVYVGPLERGRYPQAGLDKFEALLTPVFQSSHVTVYRGGARECTLPM